MKLTSTTNKHLGNLLSIHQSQISRMRSGARGIPGNGEYIRIMAEHFASLCVQDYQRSALAEALGRPPLRLPVEKNILSVILAEWLMGTVEDGGEKAELFLRNYRAFTLSSTKEMAEGEFAVDSARSGDVYVYYGDSGKRAAIYAFLGYLLELGEPQQIDISTDEGMEWLLMDGEFAQKVQEYMNILSNLGFTCRRIVGPMNNLDYTYSALKLRWLPHYISGHATSYYYPRLRDCVYHRTMLVSPGKGVVFSTSVGRTPRSKVTFFVKDGAVANAFEDEFQDYLTMCVSHMAIYDIRQTPERFMERFIECECLKFPCIQRSNSLSTVTMPSAVAASIRLESQTTQRLFMDAFVKRVETFKAVLKERPFTDVMYLASPEEVASNTVPIFAALTVDGAPRYYTVETYLLHLRSILWYIEHVPNYHVVLMDKKDEQLSFTCVKENHCVLLVRESDPYSAFEVAEANLISAFSELLHRELESGRPDMTQRRLTIARLREHIRQLELMKNGEGA